MKPFARAKSRLASEYGVSREALAHAFFRDTLETALDTPTVVQVLVVTGDGQAATESRRLGAVPVPDEPPSGLNAAISTAAHYAQTLGHGGAIAVVTADLPALRRTELAAVLEKAAGHRRAFLADHAGIGTTVLAAADPQWLRPAFEGNSRRSHTLTGAREIDGLYVPGARLDVDTPDDLQLARRLGVGPHTYTVLASTAGHAATP